MNFKKSKLKRLERYLFRYIRAGTSLSLPTMKRFEIFDEESWTRSDPLSSCLSEEQVHHASRRTSLFLIDPASALWTVTNPTCRSRGFPRTLDRLQFAFWYSTFYTKRLLCPPSRAFVLYHEIFPHNPESSVLTIAPRMKRNYGGKKVGPCEKQKLIVTLGRSMALCNPIWSTEQTHRSRIRARSGFLQGARLKTTCRCCSSLDDNLPWEKELVCKYKTYESLLYAVRSNWTRTLDEVSKTQRLSSLMAIRATTPLQRQLCNPFVLDRSWLSLID